MHLESLFTVSLFDPDGCLVDVVFCEGPDTAAFEAHEFEIQGYQVLLAPCGLEQEPA